jgi:hypothetical protein
MAWLAGTKSDRMGNDRAGSAVERFEGKLWSISGPKASPSQKPVFCATFDGETGTRTVTEARASLPAVLEADDHDRRVGRPGRI